MNKERQKFYAIRELKVMAVVLAVYGACAFGISTGKSIVQNKCRTDHMIQIEEEPLDGKGVSRTVNYLCLPTSYPVIDK
jgi:hypothetical protein